ncbi:MAG: hypothetical protein U9M95_03005, partial [Candidatus Altiarchaeota archaeon]|nr:hypothetical protein [Candidatus Altiarchaeota archaeon]
TVSTDLSPHLNWSTVTETNFANYTIEASTNQSFPYVNHTYNTHNKTESNYSITSAWTTDTTWYWRVTAFDKAGHYNRSGTFIYTTDTKNPGINYTTPTEDNDTYWKRNWIYVNVSVTESHEENITFYLYNNVSLVNETTYTDGTHHINFTNLGYREYWFEAIIYDEAGNTNSTGLRKQTLSNVSIYLIPPTEENDTYWSRDWIYVRVAVPISEVNVTFRLFNETSPLNETTYSNETDYWINFTSLGDDKYWFNVSTCDSGGGCYSTETRKQTLDTTPPTEPILLKPPDGITSYEMTPLLNWTTVTEINFRNYLVEVDNSWNFDTINYLYNVTDINESHYQVIGTWGRGIWFWRVTAYDLAGNYNRTDYFTYNVMGTGPSINYSSPSGYLNDSGVNLTVITGRNATCKYDYVDREFLSMQYTFADTGGINHYTPSDAIEGLNQYYVRCADDINGTNTMEYSITISFILDTQNPTITINPPDNATIADSTPELDVVMVDANPSSIWYSYDNSSNITGCSNGCAWLVVNIGPLTDGAHNVTVYANDSASNTGVGRRYFSIDTSPPAIVDAGPTTEQSSATVTIQAVTDEPSVCRYNESNISYNLMSSSLTGTEIMHEKTITAVNGSNTFHILCMDTLRNTMTNPTQISFNVTVIEGGAPSINIGGVEEDYEQGSIVTIFASILDGTGYPVDPGYCNATIKHWNGTELVYDVTDAGMIWIETGNYYYNYQIPANADRASYGILVEANPSGIDTQAVSGFHVIEGIICGNGVCQTGENCENCPADCGACPTTPVCGDASCESGENCENCPADCGACPTTPVCGDASCDSGENCENCPADCGICLTDPVCGDASCNRGETCENCPADCGVCPMSSVCGDASCDSGENCENCPADCGACPMSSICGDASCGLGETCENCPADCGACPSGVRSSVQGLDEIRESLTSIENKTSSIENKTDEIKALAQKIWNNFKKTNSSVIQDEKITSYKLSQKSSINIQYNITVPVKEGYSAGDYLPVRWKFWFVDEEGRCIDQGVVGDIEPQCTPLIAETIGRANDTFPIEIKIRPSLNKGNYSLVREFEVDPEQVWISYGRGIIAKVAVMEDNPHPQVEVDNKNLKTQRNPDEKPGIIGRLIGGTGVGNILAGIVPLLFLVLITLIIIVYNMSMTKKEEKEKKWYEK